MNILISVLGWFSGLPSYVLVGIVFLILGLAFRAGISTSIRSALLVGGGVLSITTIAQMLVNFVSPMANQLIEHSGFIKNDVLDVGIAPVFSACVSLPFFAFLYPIGLAVNCILLKLKWTKTINVDFLDLFAILLPFIPVWIYTHNAVLVLVLSVVYYAFCLKVADWTANYYQEYFELEGVSITHPHDAVPRLICIGLNWVFDRIPGLNKIDITIGDIQKKLGLFGDPAFLSFAIGTLLGLFAHMDVASALGIGVAMATAGFLFPKAVGIVMEGLRPISEKMRTVMQKHFHIEDANIGMDSAILAGYPEVISIGAVCLPIVMFCYFLLPAVRVIPSGEALLLVNTVGFVLPLMGSKGKKGNAFRTILAVVILIVLTMHGSTYMAHIITDFCKSSGIEVAEGTLVTSSVLGHPLVVFFEMLAKLFVS